MKKQINVLSLFDGISCCRLALERAGIDVGSYYAAEIDRYAITVAQHNYPTTVQLGDVMNWRDWDIDWSSIDLVTGGFPCQAWSMAGKQLGDRDERGKMFWVMLDIMAHVLSNNPNADFLIENVRMKKEFEDYITHHTENALGNVHKILINSALVSAQNRNRFYWCSWKNEQPLDRDIRLVDVIEHGFVVRDKSYCIDANYSAGMNLNSYLKHSRRQLVFENEAVVCGAQRGRYVVDGVRQDHKMKTAGLTTQRLELRKDTKTNTLTTVQKDNLVVLLNSKWDRIIQRPRGFNRGGTLFEKSPSVTSSSWQHNNHLTDGIAYRKLTPLECERLQTVPDNYTLILKDDGKQLVSNTQRYKMLGNAWTVDVIVHLFNGMRANNER